MQSLKIFAIMGIGFFISRLDAQNRVNVPILKDSVPKVLPYTQLESFLTTQSDSVYVVNFWATWCGPCVAELPYFEEVNKMYAARKVKVILVSLDFKSEVKTRLIPFLKKKKLKSEVVFLGEAHSNSWMPKVDEHWSGDIPATLFFNREKRVFVSHSFKSFRELDAAIEPFLK